MSLPYSCRYLILDKNDLTGGVAALKKLRGSESVDEELEEIRAEANTSEDSGSMSVLQLITSPQLRLALFITICVHLSQQLSGIVAIFYYSTTFFQVSWIFPGYFLDISWTFPGHFNFFFQNAGISCNSSQYATLGVGAIMVTMTLVTIPLMDKLGRRTIHFVSNFFCNFCNPMYKVTYF